MRFRSALNDITVALTIALFSLGSTISAHDAHAGTQVLDTLSSDLASMLQNPPVQQREIFSHALRIIHSMESSPSCNRLAALTLINSCQSLEMSAKGSSDAKTKGELILDGVKSEYAIRLAVCELNGAKANLPQECAVFIPSSYACGKFRFRSLFTRQESHSHDELCYPEAAGSQVRQCLQALESRPQWWISYSNARQNAVVMCQASRDAIERDEKLSLYRSLAEVTSDITSALAKSVQETLAQRAEQMAFSEAVKASQAQALSGLKNWRNEALSALSELVVDMRFSMQNMINTMSQAWMAAEARRQNLIDQRLANLNITLAAFEITAANLKSTVNETTEAFEITVANLKSTVDETTEKIQQMAMFSGIGAILSQWGGMLFVIAGIWFASKRVAVCLAIIVGITWLFYTAGVLTWLGGASDQVLQAVLARIISITTYASNFPYFIMLEGLLALLCLCLLSLGAGSIYLRFVKDDQGEVGLLPEIEALELPASIAAGPQRHYIPFPPPSVR